VSSDLQVANAGPIRPPLVYAASTGIGLLLHSVWPEPWLPAELGGPLGIALVLIAVVLFVSAVRTLRRARTPVPGNQPTTAFVRLGPYRWSRNPIYLAFTLGQIAVAAGVNSVAVLLALFPALALIMRAVIPREERYLEARFGDDYRSYKRAVRRWL
jgi:protein-S-isoprenylcysteine O-methyltransferase Ste14